MAFTQAAERRLFALVHSRYGRSREVDSVVRSALKVDRSVQERMRSVGRAYHKVMKYAISQIDAERRMTESEQKLEPVEGSIAA